MYSLLRSSIAVVAVAGLVVGCGPRRPAYEDVVTTDVVAAIEFRVDKCAVAQSLVTCQLSVTNRGEDARVIFTDADIAVFAEGVQFSLASMSFAGSPSVAVNTVARAGAAQRLDLVFKGAPQGLRSIRLVEIKVGVIDRAGGAGSEAPRPVQLRNLRIGEKP